MRMAGAITTATTMTEAPNAGSLADGALYRLMAWLSPSYPVGAFTHSHGLEWVIEAGAVLDAGSLYDWIEDIALFGAGRQDAILLATSWRAVVGQNTSRLIEIAELAAALAPSKERQLETMAQGRAFKLATDAAWPVETGMDEAGGDLAYPVAVGVAAAAHDVPLRPALTAYLHAFAANIVSAGVRLVPLGQTDGQRLIARLEPVIERVAEDALGADLDDLGGCVLLADIASMRHETQYTRLFRT